jgi:hypothetical protein
MDKNWRDASLFAPMDALLTNLPGVGRRGGDLSRQDSVIQRHDEVMMIKWHVEMQHDLLESSTLQYTSVQGNSNRAAQCCSVHVVQE